MIFPVLSAICYLQSFLVPLLPYQFPGFYFKPEIIFLSLAVQRAVYQGTP
jgi:hypothetical protein